MAIDPRKLDEVLAGMGFTPAPPALTIRQLDAARNTLGQLSGEDHPEVDGALRDEIGHVIFALEQIAGRRRRK